MLSGIWKKRGLKGLVIIFILSILKSSLALAQTPGTLKWEFLAGGSIRSSPAIGADGTIYVGSRDGKLYAINPDGTEKWEFLTGERIDSSPAIGADGTIYVGSWDGKLYAINPDGTEKWEFLTGEGQWIHSSPAIGADGTIYVGSNIFVDVGSWDGKLYAINPDGTEKWEFLTGGYIYSSPAIGADGTIYVGNFGYDPGSCFFYAINPDGTEKWEFLAGNPIYSSPAIGADGTIYVGSEGGAFDGKLYAINPDGILKWEFLPGTHADIFSSPAIGADGTIYVGDLNGGFRAINPDGILKWEFLPGDSIHSSPAIGADGTIYVSSFYDGKLYAIYSDSYGLADSPWPMFHHDLRHTGRAGQEEKVIIPLTLDEAYEGTIQLGLYNYFSLEMEAVRSLVVEVVPQAGIDSLIFDGKFGQLPLYAGTGDYTTRSKTPRGKYELLISPTEAGTYYLSLFGYDIISPGGNYTITTRYADKYLSDISPRSAGNAGTVNIFLKGLGFIQGIQAELGALGLPVLTPENITVSSPTEALARFNLSEATAGLYDVTVIWPDSTQDSLTGAFEITSSGIGPRLEAHLIAPEAVRFGRKSMAWLEYENTGDADMPAPLFTITGNCQLSLNSKEINKSAVHVLGIGNSALPGILGVGESRRIPVYFVVYPHDSMDFTLSVTRDSAQAIDWPAQKDLMKPPDMDQGEWDALWPNLIARLGDTWTQYLEVLRADALRMKGRGIDGYDVHKLIRLESRQAAGEPIAAVSGVLRDMDTGIAVQGIPIKARNADGSVLKQVTTSFYPEGHFVIEDLPDGTYEVLPEGYYFEDPVLITISNQEDVNGLSLSAKQVPIEEVPEEEIGTPDHHPAMTRDEAGNIYLVWEHGNEIWWAINSGAGWDHYGNIPDVEGSNPVIVYDPGLLDGGTSPGLFCAWESNTDPKTIAWSAGRATADDIVWSEPQALTSDSNDDFSTALIVDDNHNPLILWLQVNSAIEDDTDLYYQGLDLSGLYLNWLEQVIKSEEEILYLDASGPCKVIAFAKGKSLPKWIPIIGGKYAFELNGSVCGVLGCSPSLSGDIDVSVDFGKNCEGSGHAGAEAHWTTEPESCVYIFKQGSCTLGAGASAEIFSPPIPIVILSVPIGIAKIGGHIEGSADGSLVWKSNFPGWPNEGSVLLDAMGGPKGVIELLGGGLAGEVTGTASVETEYKAPPSSFEFKGYCLSLEGEIKGLFGFKRHWKKNWGTNCAEAKALLGPLMVRSYRNSLLKSGYRLMADDVPVYEEIETIKDALTGTGSVYEGDPVLGDISMDFYNDGMPAVAKCDTGEIIVVWTKDFAASDLGAKVYTAIYDGADWGTPSEITPDIDFNKDTAVVFDSNSEPMAIWSSASNEGLDYELSSVEEILNAIDNADIMYSRRIGGEWTAPETLTTLPGKDEQGRLSPGPGGEVTAVWLNQSDNVSTVYASFWNGGSWSGPVAISSAALAESPVVTYTSSARPMAIWAQDGDADIDTFDDWGIYFSTWDGSSWSSPTPVELQEAGQQLMKATAQKSLPAGFGFLPPDECCEEDEDPEPPDPPSPPKEDIEDITVPSVESFDPNEKVATQGQGEQHYVSPGDRLRYTVYFENKADATAPAQEVFITDYLDLNLDWPTLRLEEVAFGDIILANPQDSPIFNDRVTIPDYRQGEEKQWWVDIDTEINAASRCLKPTFRILDPETGDLPEDPFAGFLPPEDGTGRGQGYTTFSICTKNDLQPETTIWNEASIVFDTNDPIVTNEVFNTIKPNIPVIPVALDIKPTSCPNPINDKSKGVLPVAILGTGDFDVSQVDPASVVLEGIAPLRWAMEDVTSPYEPFLGKEACDECNEEGPDGYMDLTLKFSTPAVVEALGDVEDGDCLALTITGNLKEEFGCTPIVGEDVVLLIKN
jgi:outer membrane protein assembly factor BamB